MGLSASKNKSSQTTSEQIDPVLRAFVNDFVLKNYQDITSTAITGEGSGEKSFIPDQSADTESFYKKVRSLDTKGANTDAVNSFYKNILSGDAKVENVDPALMTAIGYTPTTSSVVGYDPTYAQGIGYQVTNAQAAQASPISTTGYATGAQLSSPYQSQYLTDVIYPALSDYDTQAARTLNALQAARDSGTAFGDRSRIADAVYMGESDKARANLQAQLLKDAFTTSTGYGLADADRATSALSQDSSQAFQQSEGNANRLQQTNLANTSAANDASRFYADMYNNFAINNADIENNASKYWADAANANNSANADRANAASQVYVDAANNAAIQNQVAINQARQFNVGTAFQNLVNQSNAASSLSDQDQALFQRTLAGLGLLQQSGESQDAYNQAKAREPLDLLLEAAGIASGVPYGRTSTTTGKSSGKAGNISFPRG